MDKKYYEKVLLLFRITLRIVSPVRFVLFWEKLRLDNFVSRSNDL